MLYFVSLYLFEKQIYVQELPNGGFLLYKKTPFLRLVFLANCTRKIISNLSPRIQWDLAHKI